MFLRKVVLLLCIFTVVSVCRPVFAEMLTVPSVEYPTIQLAIDDANNGDEVVVAEGRYFENLNFLGKAIVVRSTAPNDSNVVAGTIIDGNQPSDANFGSVVIFNSGEDNNSVLSGFTITGGTGSWMVTSWRYKGRRWNRCGGGVLCYNMSEPTITKNVFTENITEQGGGVYVFGDPVNAGNPSDPAIHLEPIISDNIFIDNTADIGLGFEPPNNNYPFEEHGDGGAIVCFQGVDANITGNLIENNHAHYYGGGIHLRQWSHGTIENNHVKANDSMLGAGIHITYDSSPLVYSNLIEDNTAGPGGGGGLYIYARSDPVVKCNIISGNVCINGAGIAVYYSSKPLICNNFIVENISGAGIRARGNDSDPEIINNTITNNSANINSAGIDCTENADPIITNNIISSNGPGFGIYADSLSNPVIQYNNVWANEAGNYNDIIGDQNGINGNISQNPLFASSTNYHILPESQCVNAGDPNTENCEFDIDNEERIFDNRIDIGADEFVTNQSDFNVDGIVDCIDLLVVSDEWLSDGNDLQSDFIDDDFIDFSDFAKFSDQWLWTGGWYNY